MSKAFLLFVLDGSKAIAIVYARFLNSQSTRGFSSGWLRSDIFRLGLVMRGKLLLFFIFVGIFVIPPFISCQSAQPAMAAPTTIDWAQGAIQDTPVNCGVMVFNNLDDKHSYSLLVRGTVSGTCSFESQGLHFHLPFNHGATTDGSPTIYNFIRFGSDVYVTYMPGY